MIVIAISAIGFGLWRRMFGGWLSLSRVMLLCLSVAGAAALAYHRWGIDWRVAVVAACWAWLWADGHKFDPPGKVLAYRYLAPMAVCGAIVGIPWLVLIGPGIFAAYWASWRIWPAFRFGSIIDGCYSYAELAAGFWAGAVLATVCML